MAILAECDICGNQHRVKDALVGLSIRCKDCGVEIKVPADQFITADAFIEEGGRLHRREKLQASAIWPWMVSGLVTVLVAVALFSVIWMLISK